MSVSTKKAKRVYKAALLTNVDLVGEGANGHRLIFKASVPSKSDDQKPTDKGPNEPHPLESKCEELIKQVEVLVETLSKALEPLDEPESEPAKSDENQEAANTENDKQTELLEKQGQLIAKQTELIEELQGVRPASASDEPENLTDQKVDYSYQRRFRR